MIDHFTITLTCTNRECDHYLVPVDVDTTCDLDTGACFLDREDDWVCECGKGREDIKDPRRRLLDGVEWQAERVRRRYAGATV